MPLPVFLSTVLVLLLTPGPTNTLMAVAGAQGGGRSVLRLIPAELAGYLCAVLPLAWAGTAVLDDWPALAHGLTLAAAIWVMGLAVRLWRQPPARQTATVVTARSVYLTTLLNPKAMIFGLVLLPAPQAGTFGAKLGLFCLAVVAVALVWGAAGSLTRAGGKGPERLLLARRIASLWLAVVSMGLVGSLLRV